jgi:hypothetical protein
MKSSEPEKHLRTETLVTQRASFPCTKIDDTAKQISAFLNNLQWGFHYIVAWGYT